MAITQTITVLPTPPSRADPANFDARADGFLSALPTMQTEMNTWAGQANSTASETTNAVGDAEAAQAAAEAAQAGAEAAQGTATTQAGIATTQAGIATTQAGTATTQAGIATTQAGIATTQAGIATTKAGEAAASAALAVDVVSGGLTSTTPAANKIPLADGAAKIALGWLDLTGYAPAADGVTNGNSHDHNGGDGGQIAYANLSGLPTLGTAAATASSDYAPAAQGVTNGNSHDHNGGDGAQIAYASLSGLPTLGTAAATASSNYAPAAQGVTNGNSHDHTSGAGAAITEVALALANNTTNNASTTKHGFESKATAPASGLRSVLAIDNGETARTDKALFDATNPAALGSAAPGSAMTAARRDHVHALPDGLVTNGDSHDHNGGDGAQIAYSSLSGTPSVRERLTAARHYYVRTDGSDANTGLANTAGGAFLTVQKAVDVAASLDVGLYNVYLSIGSGTYDGVIVLKPYVTGGGQISIEGSATPANHILTNTSSDYNGVVVVAANCGWWRFYGVRISVSATGYKGIDASGLSRVYIGAVDFTGGTFAHLYAAGPASIYCEAGYSISGGVSSGNHIDVRSQGVFSGYGTITLTGTPAFAGSFVFADVGGCASFDGISFSGSATGSRYGARAGGIVATFGGETYLPGDSAGTTASGGIYA